MSGELPFLGDLRVSEEISGEIYVIEPQRHGICDDEEPEIYAGDGWELKMCPTSVEIDQKRCPDDDMGEAEKADEAKLVI